MSLTLILMRHAKSSWDDPALDDFDRPLNGRGRNSAPAIGQWLAKKGYLPDEVIVSGARRTVETWSRMAGTLPATATMRSDPALFHASPDTILGVLRGARAPTVMLIGHNPGIAEFAARVVRAPHPHDRFEDFPTAATAVMRFGTAGWSDVNWGTAGVLDFAIPRELLG
ncbi:MAG: histidine phosphatase family protein [Paracoccaceae bacterium]|nr:histidine phosphatase family protein [Paracoccaceae bacterium]